MERDKCVHMNFMIRLILQLLQCILLIYILLFKFVFLPGHFDDIQTSTDKLTHLAASRPKGPTKRPPSQVFNHTVGTLCIHV